MGQRAKPRRPIIALTMNAFLFCAANAFAANCPAGDPIQFDRQGDWHKTQEWENCRRTCSADADCLAIPSECGGWGAINKQYEAEFKSYYADLRPRIDCAAGPVRKSATPPVVCVKQHCTVKP